MSSLLATMRRDVARMFARREGNVADVTVLWNAADLAAADANLEATAPTPIPQSGTWPAFVEYVEPTRTGIRQNAEVQVGDVILDFLFDASFPDNAKGATFRIQNDPAIYVQKSAGKDLASAWDVVVEGQHVMKTILVTRQG